MKKTILSLLNFFDITRKHPVLENVKVKPKKVPSKRVTFEPGNEYHYAAHPPIKPTIIGVEIPKKIIRKGK
jgi:hypothetical protein